MELGNSSRHHLSMCICTRHQPTRSH